MMTFGYRIPKEIDEGIVIKFFLSFVDTIGCFHGRTMPHSAFAED